MLDGDHSGSERKVEWDAVAEEGNQDSLEDKSEVGEMVEHSLLRD